MWKLPVIIVNFKLYHTGSGERALNLAKILDRVAEERDVSIAIAVNPLDFSRIREEVNIPVMLQHVDPVPHGAHTGRINIELAKESGVEGLLINHSERRLTMADIDYLVQRARELHMVSVVCTNNARVSGAVAFLNPDFVAMEPPELIGGEVSVSTARPEAIVETIDAVKSVRDIPVLVGAGIKNGNDVKKAIELGAKGVLVASGVVKAKDPERAINNLIDGMM